MKNFDNLNERLSYLLKNKGITPYQLSRDTGVTQGCISRILKGETKRLRENNVDILAKYFNVTPEWLRGGIGTTHPAEELIPGELKTADKDKLISAYNTLAISYQVLAEAYTRLLDYLKNEKGINI